MKRFVVLSLYICSCLLLPSPDGACAAEVSTEKSLKNGFVSVRHIVEQSKVGKADQEAFDKLKKQLEQAIEQKEKELNDLAPKFSDEYLDTLTPEAERDLKEKFKNLSQDLSVQQNQYYQTLNQVNAQIMQALAEQVKNASKIVAKKLGLDTIMNDEVCFYNDPSLDVTKEVVAELDIAFESEKKTT